MDKQKLKEKLHQYIDATEDEAALQMLHEATVAYEINVQEEEYELTPAQEARLKESIKQADEGKTISHEEAMKRLASWRSK